MTTKFRPAVRIARRCSLLALATCSVALQGQSLPYTLNFQSMTVGALPTGLTFAKPTADTSPGPAVSPPTANSTSGPVGLLVNDTTTSPVAACFRLQHERVGQQPNRLPTGDSDGHEHDHPPVCRDPEFRLPSARHAD